jgi:hypothetical protein
MDVCCACRTKEFTLFYGIMWRYINHYHHQPNVPTAGAQTFLMYLPTKRTAHNPPRGPSADWWVLRTANTAGNNGLMCLSKHGGARDNNIPPTYPLLTINRVIMMMINLADTAIICLRVYYTSDPPRHRTGTMLIIKCFSTILCMVYEKIHYS